MRLPNLRQLQAFKVLVHTQSVTETARQLNVTQPAVSKMLSMLEASLGRKLFDRVGGRIFPSRDAMLLLPDVERIFVHLATLQVDMDSSGRARDREIAISAIPTLASVVSRCLADLTAEYEDVGVKLVSQNFSDVVQQVSLAQTDLGFMYGHPGHSESINAELLSMFEVVAVMRPEHPLAEQEHVTPKILAGHSVILWEPLTPTGRLVREAFLKEGVFPKSRIETNSSSISRRLAGMGKGVALIDLPTAIIEGNSEPLVVRPFKPKVPLRLFCLTSIHRPPSRPATSMLRILKRRLKAGDFGLT